MLGIPSDVILAQCHFCGALESYNPLFSQERTPTGVQLAGCCSRCGWAPETEELPVGKEQSMAGQWQ